MRYPDTKFKELLVGWALLALVFSFLAGFVWFVCSYL